HVQALVAQASVVGLDERILGFAGPDKIELHPTLIRPVLEGARGELRTVIDGDRARPRPSAQDAIEGLGDRAAGHHGRHQQRALATPLIHDGEPPELPPVSKASYTKSMLQRSVGCWRGAAMQLQAFQPIQASHALLIHEPAPEHSKNRYGRLLPVEGELAVT